MARTPILTLLALSLVLVLSPLALQKPGLPVTLKADEPAYLLMALSLAHDGDLRCDTGDLARLFEEYPYLPVDNLILASPDGWHTVFFGKPYIYSLLAAPLAGWLGSNGLLTFNMLLFVAMLWMGFVFLRATNDEATAALFTVGFFLLSSTFAYVFWLQPELLNMCSVMACLFFGLHRFNYPPGNRWWPRLASVISGAALVFAVYNKPFLALLGVPVLLSYLLARRWRATAAWLSAALAGMALVAAVSWALTGQVTPYLGVDRAGVPVKTPHVMPIQPVGPAPGSPAAIQAAADRHGEKKTHSASWNWLFTKPVTTAGEVVDDLRYFLIGRHSGMLAYQPFAFLCLGLFAFAGWRGSRAWLRWTILASLGVVALAFILQIPFNWHGGGGFVGNRYFINAYPAFLFLVTAIRPRLLLVAGWAVGGLFTLPFITAPLGAVVPSPTLQAHTRSAAHQLLPYDLVLREIPGYLGYVEDSIYIRGRRDQVRLAPRPEGPAELLLRGADRVELIVQTTVPLRQLTVAISSPSANNPVTLRLGKDRRQIIAGPDWQQLTLAAGKPLLIRDERSMDDFTHPYRVWAYRLMIETERGEIPAWHGRGQHHFYLGSRLKILGQGQAATSQPPANSEQDPENPP